MSCEKLKLLNQFINFNVQSFIDIRIDLLLKYIFILNVRDERC